MRRGISKRRELIRIVAFEIVEKVGISERRPLRVAKVQIVFHRFVEEVFEAAKARHEIARY